MPRGTVEKSPTIKELVLIIEYRIPVTDADRLNMEEAMERLRESGAAEIVDTRIEERERKEWE